MDTPTVNTPSPTGASGRVILFDLWKTIARGPYPEPIANFRSILGLDGKVDDEQFLRVCLTTPNEDPESYVSAVAQHFGITHLPNEAIAEFKALIQKEKDGLLLYVEVHKTLVALKAAGFRLGLVTNSWPFPVRALLHWTGLDQLFEHVIASSEVGLAKQDGPEIYFLAAQMFNVLPENCVMVGDNPSLDILPVLAANAKAVLIDRYEDYVDGLGNFKDLRLAGTGVRFIRSLDQLPDVLG
jgi:HAD superfamily hydrolase (TIGR01549 family)